MALEQKYRISRATSLMDEGKVINIVLQPPMDRISFTRQHSRVPVYIMMEEAYAIAKKHARERLRQEVIEKAKSKKAVVESQPVTLAPETQALMEIPSILGEHSGHAHFATIVQQLKAKGISLDRKIAGAVLELLKQKGQVEQSGLEYKLTAA